MYGWSEAEALGMNIRDLIPAGLRANALAVVLQLGRAEVLEPYRTRRIAKDGRIVEVSLTATALVNEAGEVYAIATTERAGRGEGKTQCEENGDGKRCRQTPELRQRAEGTGHGERGRGDDRTGRAFARSDARRALQELQVHQIELEMQNEELRRAQAELEDSRARYFDLYDLAPVGYFTLGETGMILEANLTAATLLGVTRDALVGQPLGRFVAGADADMFHIHYRQLVSTGAPQACELRLSRKGAAPFTAWLEASAVASAGGAPACRVVISDISERKEAAERLRQKNNLLHVAGTMAQLGGWAIKLPQNEVTWTDETCALLDFPNGAAPPLAEALLLYPPASRRIFSSALESCARDGRPFDCELQMYTAKRRRIDVRAIGQAVRDERGNITGIEGAFQDISQRRKDEQARAPLEVQLRESQKMEALGTLAGGVAHDFNNILASIMGNVGTGAPGCWSPGHARCESLEEIRKASHRAKDLVQQILAFGRRQVLEREVISLAPVVQETVRLLRATLPARREPEARMRADAPAVLADATQMQQVLLNLCTNAWHAMHGRGGRVIEIRLASSIGRPTLDEARRREQLPTCARAATPASTVRDNGPGMDEATRARIFEPFFTTKPVGEGTGLGLAVVHGIVQAHEGAIVAHSKPGRGSSFELYFPRAQSVTHTLAAPEAATPASEGRGKHVLYVEDDEAYLFLIKRSMERWAPRQRLPRATRGAGRVARARSTSTWR